MRNPNHRLLLRVLLQAKQSIVTPMLVSSKYMLILSLCIQLTFSRHCVDAQGRTVDMGCAAPNHDYDVPLRIGLLFVILVTGAIGVFVPILTSRLTNVSMEGTIIVAMRQFGTGVIISTAIVHVSSSGPLFSQTQSLTGYSSSPTPSSSFPTTA
jgi:hypothetical protein